jgi:shikimate dehydrogenase
VVEDLSTETGGDSDRYGVAGHPVAHSWSPFIHGMFAKQTGQDLTYRLYDIEPDQFRRQALRMFTSGLRGLNVTLPHKQAAADLVNELTPRAARAGAVNTIALRADSSLLGDNTDGVGLIRDLENNLKLSLKGKRILVMGAGGAVRGIMAPVLESGISLLVIANRTPSKARALAAQFRDLGDIETCGFEELEGPPYHLIVNATSASLQGSMPDLPPGLVNEDTICYDMAYGRGNTPFTMWGKSLYAARTSKGWGMLVEQAAESFHLWRGVRPDTAPVLEALQRKA